MKKMLFCLSALTLVLIGCNPENKPNNPTGTAYTSMSIYPSELNITNDNDETTLQLVYEPVSAPYPETVTWASSDLNIAEVDELGVVYPIAEGTCEITATVGELVATCKVSVQDRSNAFRPGHMWMTTGDQTLVSKDTVIVETVGGESYKCLVYRCSYYFTGDKITVGADRHFQGSDYIADLEIPTYIIAEEGDDKGYAISSMFQVTTDPLYADSVGYIMAGSVNDINAYAQLFFTENGDMNAYLGSMNGGWLSMGDFTAGTLMYVKMAALAEGAFIARSGDLTAYNITLNWITHDFVKGVWGVAVEGEGDDLHLADPLTLATYSKNYSSETQTEVTRSFEMMDPAMILDEAQVKDLKEHAINKDRLSLK